HDREPGSRDRNRRRLDRARARGERGRTRRGRGGRGARACAWRRARAPRASRERRCGRATLTDLRSRGARRRSRARARGRALDASRIAGLCLARGGPTSHVALIAAASGIPALVSAGPAVLDVAAGTRMILDAEQGSLEIDPPAAAIEAAERAVAERLAGLGADRDAAQGPALTRDGVHIAVKANLGRAEDALAAIGCGADGCGLLRTEFLFLDR